MAISLILWCVIHSVLISDTVLAFMSAKIGKQFKYYRIFYNGFALVTFIPIMMFSSTLNSEYIFQWRGFAQIPQVIAIMISLYLFYAGGKHYDGLQFIGIRQVREGSNQKALSQTGALDMSGILGVIRHPWYSAAIIIIWIRNIDISVLIVNVILTLYLVVGTFLEERKLLLEFDEKYRYYQENVSMLFPYKWLKSKIRRRN
jgi:protein-S-isoprenylcysteine O-methyltransferase Ste14